MTVNQDAFRDSHQINGVESLRGAAALMVLVYHVVELMKIPVPDELAFIRSHFGLGVPLFFVLSGFVLAYGYAGKLSSPDRVMAFYVRRLFRIAPLFYLMLMLWLAVNFVFWDKTFTVEELFLNASFLFGLVPGTHESIVWAGWSIGIEMLFYFTFPVLILLVVDVRASLVFFIVSLALSQAIQDALRKFGLGSYVYMNLGTHLPFFAAGIACFRIWERLRFFRGALSGWTLFVVASIAAVAMVTSESAYLFLYQTGFGNIERNVWAVIFGALLLSGCIVSLPFLERGPLRQLGKLSFSLYLTHPMVMVLLIKIGLPEIIAQQVPGALPGFLVAAAMTIAAVSLVSTLTFRFVELPGINIGRRFARRATRGAGVPAR